jgi:two-component system cell cycle sensor histidine kinase/response regulator CckA
MRAESRVIRLSAVVDSWEALRGPGRYLLAVAATLVAFLLGTELSAWIGSPYLLFYPIVVLSGLLGGIGPCLVATGLSAVLAFGWILPAERSFGPVNVRDLASLALFALNGVLFAVVAHLHRYTRTRLVLLEQEAKLRESRTRLRAIEEELRLARDITARKLAEQALRDSEARTARSERRFRSLIEKSSDLIVVLDAERRISFWSPSATADLGWTSEEVVGKTQQGLGLIHADDVHPFEEALRAAASGEKSTRRVDVRYRRKDGSWRLFQAVAQDLLADPAVDGVVVNARDVTEEREAEEQLGRAQRLDSIGRLAGGIAHDFNNLLTVILSSTEGLRKDLDEGAPLVREDIDRIQSAGERARDLTRQLLAVGRKQVIAPVVLDPNEVVRDSERLLRRLIGENIELGVSLETEPWLVRSDQGRLEQVLLSLALNSRDAMPSGGHLFISTRNDPVGPANGESPKPGEEKEWVRLTVRDSGPGMSAEVRAHLFEPLFATTPHGKVTSLGLAAVHGTVEQLGGKISVKSAPGKGTEVFIWLPRERGATRPDPKPAPPVAPRVDLRAMGGTESILVVEDDSLVLNLMLRGLKSGGYPVQVARNGREALALVGASKKPFDLVIADMVMPELGGKGLAEELWRKRPEQRVLFVSGYPRQGVGEAGQPHAFADFLGKPFTPMTLLAKVRAMLDRQRADARA